MQAAMPSADADALYRRVMLRLLPFLVACYMVSVIDRLNIAMAKLQMLPELGFVGVDPTSLAGRAPQSEPYPAASHYPPKPILETS